jgi:hypothetical protein
MKTKKMKYKKIIATIIDNNFIVLSSARSGKTHVFY